MFRSKQVKIDINPATGQMGETYPSILKDKMSPKDWKTFCDSIQQAYNEEKEITRSKRNCCYLCSAVLTIPLIIPPIFIVQKYCKGTQQRSVSRLRDLCVPVCTRATKESDSLTFSYSVKVEKEDGQKYNEETQQYDKTTKKVAKHYVTVKKK